MGQVSNPGLAQMPVFLAGSDRTFWEGPRLNPGLRSTFWEGSRKLKLFGVKRSGLSRLRLNFFSKEPKNPSPIWSHIFIAQPITTTYPNNLLGKLSQIGADVSAILASLQKRGEDKPDTCLYWYYMDHICKWGMIYEIFLGGITRERNIRNIYLV